MKFGLFPVQWDDHWQDCVAECVLAEELGFDSIWIAEHHGRQETYWPAPLTALAGIAGRTRRIRLGTGILLLALYHPVQVAEEAAMVDRISDGRLILGIANGYRQEEFDLFGIPLGERGSRVQEGIEVIRRLWTEDAVVHAGRHYRFPATTLYPRPVQKSGPPIWLGGYTPTVLRRAAERADAWFPGPTTPLPELHRMSEIYLAAVRTAGKDPARLERPLAREIYVARNGAEARREAGRLLAALYGEDYLKWGHLDRPEMAYAGATSGDVDYDALSRDRFIVGDPDEVCQAIGRFRDVLGVTHLVGRMHVPGMTTAQAHASIRLFAEAVIPKFRG
jgi:probable F420-dependent oxidoreductase